MVMGVRSTDGYHNPAATNDEGNPLEGTSSSSGGRGGGEQIEMRLLGHGHTAVNITPSSESETEDEGTALIPPRAGGPATPRPSRGQPASHRPEGWGAWIRRMLTTPVGLFASGVAVGAGVMAIGNLLGLAGAATGGAIAHGNNRVISGGGEGGGGLVPILPGGGTGGIHPGGEEGLQPGHWCPPDFLYYPNPNTNLDEEYEYEDYNLHLVSPEGGGGNRREPHPLDPDHLNITYEDPIHDIDLQDIEVVQFWGNGEPYGRLTLSLAENYRLDDLLEHAAIDELETLDQEYLLEVSQPETPELNHAIRHYQVDAVHSNHTRMLHSYGVVHIRHIHHPHHEHSHLPTRIVIDSFNLRPTISSTYRLVSRFDVDHLMFPHHEASTSTSMPSTTVQSDGEVASTSGASSFMDQVQTTIQKLERISKGGDNRNSQEKGKKKSNKKENNNEGKGRKSKNKSENGRRNTSHSSDSTPASTSTSGSQDADASNTSASTASSSAAPTATASTTTTAAQTSTPVATTTTAAPTTTAGQTTTPVATTSAPSTSNSTQQASSDTKP